MKEDPEKSADQTVYRNIIKGYSEIDFNDERLFIKHVDNVDFGFVQEYENQKYKEAEEKGLFTELEKIRSLIQQELWTKEKNQNKELKDEINNLQITVAKLIIAHQKRKIARQSKNGKKNLAHFQKKE